MSAERGFQRTVAAESVVAKGDDERVRPCDRADAANGGEDLVLEIGVSRREQNGERPSRTRNAGGAVNDEAFIVRRLGVEREQFRDVFGPRRRSVVNVGDVVEAQYEERNIDGTQLGRQRSARIQNRDDPLRRGEWREA